jgi:hypothetical protein
MAVALFALLNGCQNTINPINEDVCCSILSSSLGMLEN